MAFSSTPTREEVSGLPAGVTAIFNPNATTGNLTATSKLVKGTTCNGNR